MSGRKAQHTFHAVILIPTNPGVPTVAGLIRRNRAAIERRLAGGPLRRWVSPVLYGLETSLEPRIRTHARGTVLDAGCGSGPYRHLIEEVAVRYESLDVEVGEHPPTYLSDVQDMPAVGSRRFDTVVCSEVLEHVPSPADALAEIRRVLKPGGTLVLTVPYLSRLHDEPHDYFRYTRHGLRHLLEDGGFTVSEIERTGSMFSFVGHQISTLMVVAVWKIPLVRWVVFAVGAALITLPCRIADSILGTDRLPLGYVVVAKTTP